MSSDNSTNELCSLWQAQPQASFAMSREQLRARWKRLNRDLRIRNGTAWFVCLTEIAFFVWILMLVPQPFIRIGSGLVIFGMAFLTGQVALEQRNRRDSRKRAEASGDTHSLDFLRAELERQRDFHRSVWFWSRMAALVPGLLVFGIGAIVLFPWPASLCGWAVTAVTIFIVPVAIWANRKRAALYQKQIDALDALRKSTQ